MAVTRRTLRLLDDLRAQLAGVTDATTRDLVGAWAAAYDEVAPDLTATLTEMLTSGSRVTRTQLLRSERLRRSLAVISAHLQELAEQAGVRIAGDLPHVIATAGAAQASVIDSQLPPGFMSAGDLAAWSRVDERQITAIVERSTEEITSRLAPLPAETMSIIRRELVRGVAAGSNPRETARRMVERTERIFNGNLSLTRAMRVARTEQLDASREAARVGRSLHADVLTGWTWACKLDARSCPACFAQHGTVHDVDEAGPLDHQQGRCVAVPTTRSWAALGFDIDEPDSLLPDAGQVFASFTTAEQRTLLGPARYEAWQAGDYPMHAWSTRRSTDGWRDSYVVSAVPQSRGRRSRSAA